MHTPIRPPQELELKELQSFLSTGEPYEVLECQPESSKKEVTKKFRELARIHHPDKTGNNDGGYMMTKINNAYAILNNDRLREIYDVYLYERVKYGDMEDGATVDMNDAQEMVLVGLSLFFSIASWPFSKIAIIAQTSNKSQGQIIRSIYKHKGITGFFGGSLFLLSSGVVEIAIEYIINKAITSTKASPKLYKEVARPFLKHPSRLIMDLIDIAPFSMTLGDIIYKVILKQQDQTNPFVKNNQPLQLKNLFYGATYTIGLIAVKRGIRYLIDKFDNYSYEGYIRNPTNVFFRYSNYIMKQTFLHAAVVSLFEIPIEVIRCQYPLMLLNSHLSGEDIVPSAINPISLAVNIYKSNGIMKFFSGFIPFYMSNLMESFSSGCDIVYEESSNEDEYYDY